MRGKVHEIQRTQFEREKNLTVHDGSLGKKKEMSSFFKIVTVEFQFENNNKLCNGYMEILILLCALLQYYSAEKRRKKKKKRLITNLG